jgi:hypothetical protein
MTILAQIESALSPAVSGCSCSHCNEMRVAWPKIQRLDEVASFLAESIEDPDMKTQTEALQAWRELNK